MKTRKETSRTLQKLFIGSIVVAWLAGTVQVIALAAMQYPHNPNLSGFVTWFLMTVLVPVVFVGLIYLTRRNRAVTLQSMFEVMVVSVAALAIYMVLGTISSFLPIAMLTPETVLPFQLLSTGIPLAIVSVVFLIVLLRLRKRGEW